MKPFQNNEPMQTAWGLNVYKDSIFVRMLNEKGDKFESGIAFCWQSELDMLINKPIDSFRRKPDQQLPEVGTSAG